MHGTFRETTFLCNLLPYIVGDHDFDLYLCIRQTKPGDLSRLSHPEKEFSLSELLPILKDHVFLCVLPPYDRDYISDNYVLPVGPVNVQFEVQCISMFLGIFAGVKQLKNSGRKYDYVIKTRTDYLFWDAPPFDLGAKIHKETGEKILIDAQRTCGFRYQDKPYLPWQGSISDLFSFSSWGQFFKLWDFEQRLAESFTGVPETTLFRNALANFTGETVQHPRKNESFLRQYFYIIPGEFRESNHYFRQDVLPSNIKSLILLIVSDSNMPFQQNLSLVWSTYKFFCSPGPSERDQVSTALNEFTSPAKHDLFQQLARHRI
jgi:hypothetical protein